MMTRDSIETAYALLHQKLNVYAHSTLGWQKDDIEYAVGLFADGMNRALYDELSGGRTDFLKDHMRFAADMALAVSRLELLLA